MPMKIDTTTARGTSLSMTRSAEEEHVHDAETDFSAELLEQNGRVTSEQMDKLLRQIDEQGARLSRTPTYDELKAYRTLIRNFVGEAVNSMYELHTQAGWDRMGR